MKVLKLRAKLHRRGLVLLENGDGWMVTNNGTAKALIEHEFADLDAVEAWVAALPNRLTDAEADEFDEDWASFVNQCDGCRRGLPLQGGVQYGETLADMVGLLGVQQLRRSLDMADVGFQLAGIEERSVLKTHQTDLINMGERAMQSHMSRLLLLIEQAQATNQEEH